MLPRGVERSVARFSPKPLQHRGHVSRIVCPGGLCRTGGAGRRERKYARSSALVSVLLVAHRVHHAVTSSIRRSGSNGRFCQASANGPSRSTSAANAEPAGMREYPQHDVLGKPRSHPGLPLEKVRAAQQRRPRRVGATKAVSPPLVPVFGGAIQAGCRTARASAGGRKRSVRPGSRATDRFARRSWPLPTTPVAARPGAGVGVGADQPDSVLGERRAKLVGDRTDHERVRVELQQELGSIRAAARMPSIVPATIAL